MEQIAERKDVEKLVKTFYSIIRKDQLLGPIFNTQIPNEHCHKHIEKLIDFWETNLFAIPKFKGNPTLKHTLVDIKFKETISKKHFDTWIDLWHNTIDNLFNGEKAKAAAVKMGHMQFSMILNNRSKS